jgi:hypothetical protein
MHGAASAVGWQQDDGRRSSASTSGTAALSCCHFLRQVGVAMLQLVSLNLSEQMRLCWQHCVQLLAQHSVFPAVFS